MVGLPKILIALVLTVLFVVLRALSRRDSGRE
jgi:hypothetical protein